MDTVKKNQRSLRVRRREKKNRQSPDDFQASETILFDTIIMDICHNTFVETRRMYKKSEP